jgi:hypothetical protein
LKPAVTKSTVTIWFLRLLLFVVWGGPWRNRRWRRQKGNQRRYICSWLRPSQLTQHIKFKLSNNNDETTTRWTTTTTNNNNNRKRDFSIF